MKKSYDYTRTKRSQDFRKRMKSAGFLYRSYWVHKDDEEKLKVFAEELKAVRTNTS